VAGYADLAGSPLPSIGLPNLNPPRTPGAPASPFADPLQGPEWESWYLNSTPEAGWVRYLQNQGLYGLDPKSTFARGQYGRAYGQYQSQAAQNPNLGFYDWVNGAGLDLNGAYGSVSPAARGDFSDRTFAPRARIMRAY
jgi:hypothetical protein